MKRVECHQRSCKKDSKRTCKYCKERFCEYHLKAKPSYHPTHKLTKDPIERLRAQEWETDDGHACVPYYDIWEGIKREEIRKQEEEGTKPWGTGKPQPPKPFKPPKPPEPEEEEPGPEPEEPTPEPTEPPRKFNKIKILTYLLIIGLIIGGIVFGYCWWNKEYKVVTITGFDHGACTTPQVSLWSDPGSSGMEVGTISGCPTQQVKVLKEMNLREEHWYYIVKDDTKAWVLSKYVADLNETTKNSDDMELPSFLSSKACNDGTKYSRCSSDKPYYCSNGTLIERASVCGCKSDYKAQGDVCNKIQRCEDGTIYGECSSSEPKYCDEGTLIDQASLCGCSWGDIQEGEKCVSKYMTGPKNITLYGGSSVIKYTVYEGLKTYLAGIDRSISYVMGSAPPSDKDFIIKELDNPEQKKQLDPLVDEIKKVSTDKNVQARYAIMIVQNIPYDWDGFTSGDIKGRYPYEVLYDQKGVCSEKTALLVYLLRGLGFETAVLRFNVESHDVVGLKCPTEYAYKSTGFCFVESTAPTPIGYSGGYYVGVGQLKSSPDVIPISSGDTFSFEIPSARTQEKVSETKVEEVTEPDINVKTVYVGLMEVTLTSKDKDANIGYAEVQLEGFYSSGLGRYDKVKISVVRSGMEEMDYLFEKESKAINGVKVTVKSLYYDPAGKGEVILEVTT